MCIRDSGTDCVMLSGETAGGSFPVEAVTIMAKLCVEAEQCINYENVFSMICNFTAKPLSIYESVCCSAVKTAEDIVKFIKIRMLH